MRYNERETRPPVRRLSMANRKFGICIHINRWINPTGVFLVDNEFLVFKIRRRDAISRVLGGGGRSYLKIGRRPKSATKTIKEMVRTIMAMVLTRPILLLNRDVKFDALVSSLVKPLLFWPDMLTSRVWTKASPWLLPPGVASILSQLVI